MTEIEVQVFVASREILLRRALAVVGSLLWLLFLVPPLSSWSSQYEFVQAIQFCCFAMIVPALFALCRPWRWLGLASSQPLQIGSDGELVAPVHLHFVDRVALRRMKNQSHHRLLILLFVFMVQAIAWRSSPVVNALQHRTWLTVIESAILIVAGVLFWIELIESTPLRPSATRPYRIGVSAVAMWTVWVIAYLTAMSHDSWNPVLQPGVALVLSKSADQQLTGSIMWFLSAAVFVPLVFINLSRWLQSEEDPSSELTQLVRTEHARGFFGPKL